jgi:YbgC/YbaW family acyl-CoA thioester hydrolase
MLSEFRVRTDIEVRFHDTDAMRHVNNAAYVTYLEVGRQAYWKAMNTGQPYDTVPFVLAHVTIDFRKPASSGDVVCVHLKSSWISRQSWGLTYKLTNPDGTILFAEADSVQVTYDYEAKHVMEVPDWLRHKIEAVEGRPLPQPHVES